MRDVREASVVIAGHALSFSESMTLRVAISSFLMSLEDEGLGDDAHGKVMTKLYQKHATTIQKYIHEEAK